MKHSLSFRFDRLIKLLRNEIRFNHRLALIVAGAVFAALAFIGFTISLDNHSGENGFFYVWYFITLFGGGFLYSSVSFRELNSTQETHNYLTLPASTLEKFTSKLLLSTVGFISIHLICFYLFSWGLNGFLSIIGGTTFTSFNAFSAIGGENFSTISYIKYYIILQSIFLLGAVAFRKFEIFKTSLLGFLFMAMLFFIAILSFRLVFYDFFNGWSIIGEEMEMRFSNIKNFEELVESVCIGLRYPFYVGFPLLLWTIGFFKLREKEA